MGIKDRVINILFDEDEIDNTSKTTKMTRSRHEDTSSLEVDTAPIFIDVEPTKKSNENKETISSREKIDEIVKEIKQDESYRMTENISPIFGVKKNDTKNRKTVQKAKNDNTQMYDGLLNGGINQSASSYTSVIISPIYGPLDSKTTRKNPTRTHRKTADPFARSIDDTGEFKTLYQEDQVNKEESDEVLDAVPAFEDVKEEKPVVDEKLGDTDRLSRISDRINQIKNEAAHIYAEKSEHIDTKRENAPKKAHSTISDLIHNFQKEDYSNDFNSLNPKPQTETVKEEQVIEEETPVKEEINDSEEVLNENTFDDIEENDENFESTESNEEANNTSLNDEPEVAIKEDNTIELKDERPEQLSLDDTLNLEVNKIEETPSSSIDDIFEDNVEDGKDLFSDLFGDE